MEGLVGARVARALRVWGGYAPSPTFRVFLADGRRVFFKGVDRTSNAHMHRTLAAEERVYRELGCWLRPWAPELHGSFRVAGWHVLLLEDLGPARIPPWTSAAVRRAMAGYAAFHRHSLGHELPDWLSRRRHHAFALTWTRLGDEPGGLENLAALAGARSADALAWTRAALPRLRTAAPVRLAVRVRWPARVRRGGLHLEHHLRGRAGCRGRLADYAAHVPVREDAVDAAVAAVAGYFAQQAWREPIPGLPRFPPGAALPAQGQPGLVRTPPADPPCGGDTRQPKVDSEVDCSLPPMTSQRLHWPSTGMGGPRHLRRSAGAGGDPHMLVSVLGPLEVHVGGRNVPITSAKQRALLALLALNAGQVVSADRLIDGLWGASAGADALNALQHHVSRLRRLVAPSLVTRPTGYLLDVAPGEVDALQFARLVREARAALHAGRAAEARATFRAAFQLWRAAPLAEFVDRDWAQQEAARLEELYLDALEERIEADLATGLSGELLDELRGLVAEHPFRERLWGQLMLALYRCGRQTDALVAYQDARRVLVDEHGVDPGPELARLESAILAHDPELTGPLRRVPPPTPEPAQPPPRRAGGLPAPLTSFIGRHEQVPALRAVLDDCRLVTLTGPPGVGKTRLALELGRAVQPDFSDRVWLLELAPLSSPPVVVEALAALVGVRRAAAGSVSDTLGQVIDHLRGQRGLLILDNCEHLLAGVSALVAPLLAGCPELHVLATSREPLGIAGEAQQPVPPLSLARPGTREPRELLGSEAVRLFEDRATRVRPDFALTTQTAAAVDGVCRQLDGLPLAIELAAARVNVLPVSHIARALGDRFRFLVAGSRTAPERQQTLRAAIDWSYDLLDEDERRVFERLSVFAGGCSLAMGEAVGAQLGLSAFGVLDVLARLVDKSLLVATTGASGQPRYHLLETLRAYGIERLVKHGRYDEARRRHTELFAALAEDAERELRGPRRTTWLRTLVEELDNLREVLHAALDAGQSTVSVRVAGALGFFFSTTNRVGEGRRWLEAALATADASVPPVLLARANTYLAPMLVQYAEFEPAVQVAEQGSRWRSPRATRGRRPMPEQPWP